MTKKNRSLKTILSFYVGAVIGVSNIIFAIAAGYTAIGKVDKVSTQMYLENTKVCAEKMSGWMDKQIRTVDSFVEAIKAGKYDTENFDKAEDYLAEVVTVDEDIYAMYMGRPDKSGVFSDRWDAAAEGYDPTIRDWYIKALETDKAVISEPYNDVSTNQQVITVSKAIRNTDGELTAVLASDIFVTSIVEMAAEISNGKDTYPILLDANNNIVVHKESSYIPVTDEQGNDIVTNIEETNVPECVTAEDNTIFTTKDYDGTLSVFAKQQVGNTGWHLIVSTVATTFYADNNTIILLYGGIFVFFLIWDTVAMGIIIRKRLAPLNELTLASSAMLEGKLSYVSKYRSGDEIGTACVSTEEATKKILSYINDIDAKLASMADGDFTNSVELDYIGDFVNIKNSLIAIQSSLRNTFGGIIQITNEVADGATQLSAASNELSIGATKQTSAIDSLSASLSSASEIVTATVENAKIAEGIASEMSNSVSECTTSMSELIEAMNRITTTSEEIKKINKSIEDIAFQTNILALNASVEAARAGAAGKGFAVVADEVRNLANKSSDAANTSARLIAESSEAVEKGMEYTKITADSLESLVHGTKRTIEVINAIVSDANNEEEKLSHVTSELNEISAVVQDNTATAEETAAASSSLQGQAADLNSKISRFRC